MYQPVCSAWHPKKKDKWKLHNLSIPPFGVDQGWGQQGSAEKQAEWDCVAATESILASKSVSNEDCKAKSLLLSAPSFIKLNNQKEHLTIHEKIIDIYHEKKRIDGNFIKCNYVEELVAEEGLNHFLLKLYPTNYFLYWVKDEQEYKLNVDYNDISCAKFFSYIDNEEIPYTLVDILHEKMNVLYDYHMIIGIQKFTTLGETAMNDEPVFSSFVLLKPTSRIFISLSNKNMSDCDKEEVSRIEGLRQRCESNCMFELSGPLYLDTDQTCLELINTVNNYNSPFVSDTLKSAIIKNWNALSEQTSRHKDCLKKYEDLSSRKASSFNDLQLYILNTSKDEFCDMPGYPSFSFESVKEYLEKFVKDSRRINVVPYNTPTKEEAALRLQNIFLVEVFYFGLMKNKKKCNTSKRTEEVEKIYKLKVYMKNGEFYIDLILCLDKDWKKLFCLEGIQMPVLQRTGSREKLDSYITTVAEVLSKGFREVMIENVNMLDATAQESSFLCGDRRFYCKDLRDVDFTGKSSDRTAILPSLVQEKSLNIHNDSDRAHFSSRCSLQEMSAVKNNSVKNAFEASTNECEESADQSPPMADSTKVLFTPEFRPLYPVESEFKLSVKDGVTDRDKLNSTKSACKLLSKHQSWRKVKRKYPKN